MADTTTPITLHTFTLLASFAGHLRALAQKDHAALLDLITHVGEVSHLGIDWPSITGSLDDMIRAKTAVVRMGEEIEGLAAALEGARGREAALREQIGRAGSEPSASVGAAIHDEGRIRQIVHDTLDTWLEPRGGKLVRSQSEIIRQIVREELEASVTAADRRARRPRPIRDPLAAHRDVELAAERIRAVVKGQAAARGNEHSTVWWAWNGETRTWTKWMPDSQRKGPVPIVKIEAGAARRVQGQSSEQELIELANRSAAGNFSDWNIR